MESHVARVSSRSFNRPVTADGVIDGCRRTKCLRNGKSLLFHAPRSQVFAYGAELKVVSKLAFDSSISRCVIKLADLWEELFIASAPSGDKRRSAPGPANAEFEGTRKSARSQVALRERSRLMNCISLHRDPVEERTGRQVDKLPKKILVHV